MTPILRALCVLGLSVIGWMLLIVFMVGTVRAACEPYPVTEHSPTGIVGCEVYGAGTASMWGGPGVARNDCRWPWTDCVQVRIISQQTGISVVVTPRMFCDCYTGTADERIVDLDPPTVAALGLDPSAGLWPVIVEPFRGPSVSDPMLPDTAMRLDLTCYRPV